MQQDSSWRRVRRTLFWKRLIRDPHLGAFGAGKHRYRLNAPISMKELRAFEEFFSVTLPDDYRQFLLEAGNGGAGPYYGLLPLSGAFVYGNLAKPFALTAEWDQSDCQEPEDEIPETYRDGCLAISEHGCGYWSFLVVTGPERGMVWDDFTCAGTGIRPTGKSFSAWYTRWLKPAV